MAQIHSTTSSLWNVMMEARVLTSFGLIDNYWANLQREYLKSDFAWHGLHLYREVSIWVPFWSLVIVVCYQLNVQNYSTSLDYFWWEINQLHKILSTLIFSINTLWCLEILISRNIIQQEISTSRSDIW